MAVLRAAFTHTQRLRGCCGDDSPPAASPATTAPPFTPRGNTSSVTCTSGGGEGSSDRESMRTVMTVMATMMKIMVIHLHRITRMFRPHRLPGPDLVSVLKLRRNIKPKYSASVSVRVEEVRGELH